MMSGIYICPRTGDTFWEICNRMQIVNHLILYFRETDSQAGVLNVSTSRNLDLSCKFSRTAAATSVDKNIVTTHQLQFNGKV